MTSFQTVTVNRIGQVRRAKLHGRDYLVAPMTMIVPGVLSGSDGPLYYPPEEIAHHVQSWNGVPILLGHPAVGTGRSPKVIEQTGVGQVFNARISGGKLQADAWLDVERMRALAPDALAEIERGRPVELSTGLFSKFDHTPGFTDGTKYDAVARNILADHLALLVDGERGACSCLQGCGVNNAQQVEPLGQPTWDHLQPIASDTEPSHVAGNVDINGRPCLGLPGWSDDNAPQPAASAQSASPSAPLADKPSPLGQPVWNW